MENFDSTLIIINNNPVRRRNLGSLIAVFEDAGLTVTGLLLIRPTDDLVSKQYPKDSEEEIRIGKKVIDSFNATDYVVEDLLGTVNPQKVGERINSLNRRQLLEDNVVIMVLNGLNAIEEVKKLKDEYIFDEMGRREKLLKDLIHSSASPEEAKKDISIWFETTK